MKENQHIEWKESWRDEYLKWICGFANADGGVLDIGRNDKGVVVGLPQAQKMMEDIPNKIRDVLGIMAEVNLREDAGKEYIEIRVEPYPSPISYKGEYHYRSGSTKQELKGTALEHFLLKKRGRHWDDAPEPSFTARSCSPEAMRLFKQRAKESGRMNKFVLRDGREVLLGNLELREKHGLKRAACLLFSDRPEQYVSGAWIKIGFFVTDDDLRYQDEVHGNLFEQVEKTLIANAFFRAGYIESWGRGIEKISRECREHAIEQPVYDFGMAGLMLTFRADAKQFTGEPEKTPEKILRRLGANPQMTLAEVANNIGKSASAVERAAATLVKSGRLKRIGPQKGGHWDVTEP